jgi:hypothetical protein
MKLTRFYYLSKKNGGDRLHFFINTDNNLLLQLHVEVIFI